MIAINSTVKTAMAGASNFFHLHPRETEEAAKRQSRRRAQSGVQAFRAMAEAGKATHRAIRKKIRLWNSLDDSRIRSAGRPKWTEVQRARGNARIMNAAKNMSFQTAYGTNGAPSSWSTRGSRLGMSLVTMRPGIGHSLIPASPPSTHGDRRSQSAIPGSRTHAGRRIGTELRRR